MISASSCQLIWSISHNKFVEVFRIFSWCLATVLIVFIILKADIIFFLKVSTSKCWAVRFWQLGQSPFHLIFNTLNLPNLIWFTYIVFYDVYLLINLITWVFQVFQFLLQIRWFNINLLWISFCWNFININGILSV